MEDGITLFIEKIMTHNASYRRKYYLKKKEVMQHKDNLKIDL
jgi:hypothetical protein